MRNLRFTFVYSQYEKQLLEHIANLLQRSKSDTLRYLIHDKAEKEGLVDDKEVALRNKSISP